MAYPVEGDVDEVGTEVRVAEVGDLTYHTFGARDAEDRSVELRAWPHRHPVPHRLADHGGDGNQRGSRGRREACSGPWITGH